MEATVSQTAHVVELGPAECWRLPEAHHVGRLAYVVRGEPEVVPVNYMVHRGTIVFRTDDGTKERAVRDHPSVAFQLDHADPDLRTGWSVLRTRADSRFRSSRS